MLGVWYVYLRNLDIGDLIVRVSYLMLMLEKFRKDIGYLGRPPLWKAS